MTENPSSTFSRIRVGTVPFLNAAPLTHGLDRDPAVELTRLLPVPLAHALEHADVDAALVPSAAYFRIDALRLLDVAAISSDGPVRSVRLFHEKPLDRLRRVALDAGSVTSAALARLVLHRAYDARPEFVPAAPRLDALGDADAVLVIGDAALTAEGEALRRGIGSLDLGAEWKALANLPFVWAVFALRESAPARIGVLLRDARDRGLASLREIAAAYSATLSIDAASLEDYLARNIRYSFGERELAGLRHFRAALLEEGLLDRERDIRIAAV